MRKLKILVLFSLILAITGCPAPCDVETSEVAQIERDAVPIVRALENFRLAKNDYPTLIKELQPEFIERLPDSLGGRKFFYRRESADQYTIKLAARSGGFYSGSCALTEIGRK